MVVDKKGKENATRVTPSLLGFCNTCTPLKLIVLTRGLKKTRCPCNSWHAFHFVLVLLILFQLCLTFLPHCISETKTEKATLKGPIKEVERIHNYKAYKREIHEGSHDEKARQIKMVQYSTDVTLHYGSFSEKGNSPGNSAKNGNGNNGGTLPKIAKWPELRLSTYLPGKNGEPLVLYKPVVSVPNVLERLGNSVRIIAASNGAFYLESLYRPRTELTELQNWDCRTTNKSMNFTMIVDQFPNATLVPRVVLFQLFRMLQLNGIVTNGKLILKLAVNGRYTKSGKETNYPLSDESVNMIGKKFTFSCTVHQKQVFYSYEDESGRSLQKIKVTGYDFEKAASLKGACRYAVGHYLQIKQDSRFQTAEYAISRLFHLEIR
jgi:hypothetical protein